MKTKMPQNLPSKKVFAVAFFAIVLVAWVIVGENTPKTDGLPETLLSAVAEATSPLPDLDGDGLSDWQEELYGTNSSRRDSDGDGVSDKDEVESQKRIMPIAVSDSVYTAVNRLGEELKNTSDPTANLTLKPVFYDDRYLPYDVRVIPANHDASNTYILEALSVLAEHALVLKSEPLEIIDHWLLTYGDDDTEKLQGLSQTNMRLSEELMTLSVPSDLVDIHLLIANSLYHSALALLDVEKTTLDPTAGFFATANYANYETKYTRGVIALTQYYNDE